MVLLPPATCSRRILCHTVTNFSQMTNDDIHSPRDYFIITTVK